MSDHTLNPAALAEQIVKALYDDDTALRAANHTGGAFDVDAYCAAQAEVVMPILAAAFAAVERVRSLHVAKQAFYPNWDGAVICETCNSLFPCPTLRELEETP